MLLLLLAEYFIEAREKRLEHRSQDSSGYTPTVGWARFHALQNVAQRAVILCDDKTFSIDESCLHPGTRSGLFQSGNPS